MSSFAHLTRRALVLVALAPVIAASAACGGGSEPAQPAADAAVEAAPVLTDLGEQIDMTEIAVYQAVKASIWKDGARAAIPNAPVVTGRPGLLRVFVKPRAGWKSRGLLGKLRIVAPGAAGKELYAQEIRRVVGKGSVETDFGSTFTYELPADAFVAGARYSVTIRDEAAGGSNEGSTIGFPNDGSLDALGVKAGAETLRVKIVPVRYDADGSGRVASTSEDQLKLYRNTLYQLYPAASVEVTVRSEPFVWTQAIDGDGTGWDEFLTGMWDLRASDAPPDDVYYAGAFESAPSMNQYCRGGCVLGLAGLASPNEVGKRALAMVGFEGDQAAGTLAHELGHTMGRAHAPCGGPAGIDKKYPYDEAYIGSWGWDILTGELREPDAAHDMMGYCDPRWISDYNYAAIQLRMSTVNAAVKSATKDLGAALALRAVHVGKDGVLRRGRALRMAIDPDGPKVSAEIERADGTRVTVLVPWVATSGANGGFPLLPEGESLNAIRVRHLDGRVLGTLARAR
jgi:hypothetical protein